MRPAPKFKVRWTACLTAAAKWFCRRENFVITPADRSCGAVTRPCAVRAMQPFCGWRRRANCPVIILGEPVEPSETHHEASARGRTFSLTATAAAARELLAASGEGSQIRNNGITVQRVSDSVVENVTCARCRSGGLVTTHDVRRLTVPASDGVRQRVRRPGVLSDGAFGVYGSVFARQSRRGHFPRSCFRSQCHQQRRFGRERPGRFHARQPRQSILQCHHPQQPSFRRVHGERGIDSSRAACGRHRKPNARTMPSPNLTADNCGGAAFRVNNVTCTNNVIIRAQFARNLKGGLSLAQPNLVTVE